MNALNNIESDLYEDEEQEEEEKYSMDIGVNDFVRRLSSIVQLSARGPALSAADVIWKGSFNQKRFFVCLLVI